MVALPDICESWAGGEWDVASLRDVFRECTSTWQDGMWATDSLEGADALPPEIEAYVRSFESLSGGSKGILRTPIILGLLT